MNRLLIVLGPTSTGKTDLAISLAKKFDGELVACDSRQVYKSLDIGTGKLPGQIVKVKKSKGYWELDGVKIWMYDVADPNKQYTVADYVKDASRVIEEISNRKKLPIIVGGTGFYLNVLLEGIPSLTIPINISLRKKLEKLSRESLQKKMKKISPDKWNKLNESDKQNPRRLLRAIEIIMGGQKQKKNNILDSKLKSWNILKIGLTAPRQILYQRIDERVISRINQGMITETKDLHSKGLALQRMKQLGLEYGVLADYISGRISDKDELIKILQNKIHGYARRQITWFKKEKNIKWFDITDQNYQSKVVKLMSKWYYMEV
ncbi:tRNA (adenosine(37)-N6)-dimethylallyltransferase MiaA [Candidatus Daviesbacteria bacterium]|nr:tRNA (adenosine(37)-N6)-dimethylallyltransferase MiaA [Candidatus Daviesbacteria bacterium]